MKLLPYVLLAGATVSAPLLAEDLAGVYNTALTADPTMQQAEYQYIGSRETKRQALLNMLPVNGSASKTYSGVQSGSLGNTTNHTPASAVLSLNVNLFSWNSWINLKNADAQTLQADANYLSRKQDLISRVSRAYFNVLAAKDALTTQEGALASATRQLEQAQRRFEVGLIANTDVQIAQSTRDSSEADVIAARRNVANQEEALRAITGMKYGTLASPRNDMPLLTPDPASEDSWVSAALQNNATLVAARYAEDIAHNAYLTAFGGHIPNITVSANKSWTIGGDSTPTTTPSGNVNTDGINWSAQVSVPIFTAGLTQSRVRAAKASWDAQKASYEGTMRSTEQSARDAYQGVISQIAQVNALRQAVASSRASLAAIEAGYDVGTKTALDVLTSRQALVSAQNRYASAKYAYLNNIVALRLAAGQLDVETIRLMNTWLSENAADTTIIEPATAPATVPAAVVPAAP